MASPEAPSLGYCPAKVCIPRFPASPASLARVARVKLGEQPLTDLKLVSRDAGKGRCSLCVQYYADDAPADKCPRCSRTVCSACIQKCAVCTEKVCGFCRSNSVNLGCAPGCSDQEEAMRFRVCNACVKRFAAVEDYCPPDEARPRIQTGRFAYLHVIPAPKQYLVLGPLVVEGSKNAIASPNLTLVNLGLGGGEQVRSARDSGVLSQADRRARGNTQRSAFSGNTGSQLAPVPVPNPAPGSITVPSRKSASGLDYSCEGAVEADSDTGSHITSDSNHESSVTVSVTHTSARSSRCSSLTSKGSASDEWKSTDYPSRESGCRQDLRRIWAAMSVGMSPGEEWASSPPLPAVFAYPAAIASPAAPKSAHRTPPDISDTETGAGGDDVNAEMREEQVGARGDRDGGGEAVEGKEEPPQRRRGVRYKRRLACGGVALAVGFAVWAVTGSPPRRRLFQLH